MNTSKQPTPQSPTRAPTPQHTIDCDERNEGFCICGATPKRMLPMLLPLHVRRSGAFAEIEDAEGNPIATVGRKNGGDKDAAYIVECCNGYAALQAENAELREALIQVMDICYIEGGDYAAGLEMAVNIAKEALTRPEGGKL